MIQNKHKTCDVMTLLLGVVGLNANLGIAVWTDTWTDGHTDGPIRLVVRPLSI